MILSRYLIKEVFNALLAVTFVLLIILLSHQLVRYLGYAAAGKLGANLLFQLLTFEIPYLLALLLPLGLYLGIILAYGRLYVDNELNVMQACGLSQKHLFQITGLFTLIVTLFLLILMLWINPIINRKKENLLAESMSAANMIQNLLPGRFQVLNDGKRVIYVENISRTHKVADNIFFADRVKPSVVENQPSEWSVVSASKGYETADKNTKRNFLIAENGYRYEGTPGQNDYKIIQFKKYTVELPELIIDSIRQEKEAWPTWLLMMRYSDPESAAELQWRLSIPLSALILSLLAIPLSHVKPRQGRFSAVLPAILIYVIYINLLFVARNWMEQKYVPISFGMWWVHIVFFLLMLIILLSQTTYFRRMMKMT